MARSLWMAAFCVLLVAAGQFASAAPEGRRKRSWSKRFPHDYDLDGQVVRTELPHAAVKASEVPESLDWRDVNGISFVTKVGNQMLPRGCGSCWAFSTAGSVSDRIKIGRYSQTGKLTTEVNLAVQALLDCGAANHSIGGCHGGSAQNAFSFMYEHGIPDETCAPYIASSPGWWSEEDCWDTLCRTCDRHGNCYLTNDGKRYKVQEFGLILPSTGASDRGSDMVFKMQAEIMQRGPIVCGMYAHSSSFDDYLPANMGNYTDSVITDGATYSGITHDIELVGWGVSEDTKIPYWIGKNSYGTRWGLDGFFLIQRGSNTLNIEEVCHWAVPQLD
ncbi:papain cysteine protease [Chloropicon primus]|uniref:Papain cysteine protease n=1 Tax=Chloropicon primus TaxID=1764295 RepID=A0A5B8MJL5_9CHLO|nr:papain cysteine protease [Chloropicon primus]UPR00010.1 papain cysteine protease [Chloropicon primus]|mmetsp:Transcript_386/g.1086  ORF Transcript_386/g.1086 Transcript_386/m.1086 type:complete len:332 (+) Transcript_386:84-1079(+)|eukprot:QDZ20798.1 papain cysteine protease [Chloropicon primus]